MNPLFFTQILAYAYTSIFRWTMNLPGPCLVERTGATLNNALKLWMKRPQSTGILSIQ